MSKTLKEEGKTVTKTLIVPIPQPVTIRTFQITARYNFSIEELLRNPPFDSYYEEFENGYRFPRVAEEITDEHFPEDKRPEERDKEAILVEIHNWVFGVAAAKAAMEHLQLRPGTTKELLSLIIDHPNLEERPIAACGSNYLHPKVNEWCAVHLCRGKDGNVYLDLCWHNHEFHGRYCFLAFRKI